MEMGVAGKELIFIDGYLRHAYFNNQTKNMIVNISRVVKASRQGSIIMHNLGTHTWNYYVVLDICHFQFKKLTPKTCKL